MKFLLAILAFISFEVSAVEICAFEETSNFAHSLEIMNIKPVRVAKNHKKFTSVEKKLIHKMINLQSYRGTYTLNESLAAFADSDGERPGPNRGEISYYNFEGTQVILVHYWPGDTEVGAFFSINKNGSFKLVAEVSDSEIICK